MLLVCCGPSELCGDRRGCCSNTFERDSRFSGIGPLVYAESWPSRKDIRSRRAWLGPLSPVSLCTHVSEVFLLPVVLLDCRRRLDTLLLRICAIRANRKAVTFLFSRSAPLAGLPRSFRGSWILIHGRSRGWSLSMQEFLLRGETWRGARATIMRRTSWSRILVFGGYKHPPRR